MHLVVRLEVVDEAAPAFPQITLAWITWVSAILLPAGALKVQTQTPFDAAPELGADLAEILCAPVCLGLILALGVRRLSGGGAVIALAFDDPLDDARSGSIAKVLQICR